MKTVERAFLVVIACALAAPACSPVHRPAPSVAASISPVALATPLVVAADSPPQIIQIELSDPIFHSGETISGAVITSTNVAAVDVSFAHFVHRLPKTAPGTFAMSYTLPSIPFFLRGTYTAKVIAQNALGATAERDVTVSLR